MNILLFKIVGFVITTPQEANNSDYRNGSSKMELSIFNRPEVAEEDIQGDIVVIEENEDEDIHAYTNENENRDGDKNKIINGDKNDNHNNENQNEIYNTNENIHGYTNENENENISSNQNKIENEDIKEDSTNDKMKNSCCVII